MAFVLTLLYITVSLLSPSVLPDVIVSLHVNEILGVLVILALLPSLREAQLGSIPETYLVFGVYVSACISILATGWLSHVADIALGFFPIFFAFYFVLLSCRTVRRLQILVVFMTGIALFIFAQGAIADHTGNLSSPYLLSEKGDAGLFYRYRGLGVLADPNDLAQLFTMMIPLLWLRWKKGKTTGNLFLTLIPAAILMVAVFYTHSRGGVVALIAVCLFGFKDKLGIVKSSIVAGVLLAGLVALNITGGRGMNEDDGGRVAAWITGLEVLKAHPLFGIGIGNFAQYNDTGATAHNSYVLALAEIGLFGYFFWMGSIVATWTGLSQIVRSQSARLSPAKTLGGSVPKAGHTGSLAYMRPMLHAPGLPVSALHARSSVAVPVPYTTQLIRPTPSRGWTGSAVEAEEQQPVQRSAEDAGIIHIAKILRVALVGLLTSSFFLSRSFAMVFYILLAMSACTKMIYRERHPEKAVKDKTLVKRIWMVILSSIVLLYIFVRVRGVH